MKRGFFVKAGLFSVAVGIIKPLRNIGFVLSGLNDALQTTQDEMMVHAAFKRM